MPTTFDDELLSAYIDGTLSVDEQQRAAVLLRQEPAAARALAELRYTRTVLAAAPRLPVPRAFTLTEAMVGQTRRPSAGWLGWLKPSTLRMAAAAIAVVLLVLLLGDAGTRTQLLPNSQPAITQGELGGLAPGEGDPTDVLAKAPTTAPDAAVAGFLGLSPEALLILEIGLALLLVALLIAGWQLGRARSPG
jgi:hypothetical protein